MINPYISEDMEEVALWNEYYDCLHSLDEEYTERDPFTGSLEDYGLTVSDFITIEKSQRFFGGLS